MKPFIFLLLLTFIYSNECGRYGGSSRSSGSRSGGYSRGSYSPSHSYRPVTTRYSSARYTTARPYNPIRSSSRPYVPPRTTARPYTPVRTSQRPYQQATTRRPLYAGTPQRPYQSGTTRRPIYAGTTPRRHYSTPRTNTWGGLPPRPGSGPIGPSYGGAQKVKIVNKYNYHYPGYYSMPTHYSYPGYFHTPSYYHYSTGDTGSTALGFFLGYSLGKLTTPTFSHYSFYDGYRPRYDHYEVHHYYHNRDAVAQNQEIRSNNIVGCVGDSASVCPANTTSLCTSNGALMCVASLVATVPCKENQNLKCVTSTIDCVNNEAPECKNSNQNKATVNIPCVSQAEVHGEVKYVNNTIIPTNATTIGIPPPANITTNGTNSSNSTVTTSDGTVSTPQGPPVTLYPITTTPKPTQRRKRQAPQNFCVTIVAVPAERKATPGEEFLNDALFIAEKFVENAWNL